MSKRNPSSKASRPTQIPSILSRGPVAWKLQHNETHEGWTPIERLPLFLNLLEWLED